MGCHFLLQNPKERQCQRMFKLLHNCTHLTHEQSNAQNSPSEASPVNESKEENFKTCTQLEIASCLFCFCNSNSSMQSNVSYIGWGDGIGTYNNPSSWNLPPAQSLSHICLFATPWTVARQAPQFMELPKQEHWSGCHFLLHKLTSPLSITQPL